MNWRAYGSLVICAACLAVGAPERVTAAGVRDAAVERLERELTTTANPDSIRFELAIAYREVGLIETRRRAIELFERIRGTYEQAPRYHRELAYTLLAAERYRDARGELRRVIALEPGDADARTLIARLLLKIVLRYYDFVEAGEILNLLDSAIALDPGHHDALFTKALVLQFLRGLRQGDGPELARRSLECAQTILARDARDVQAKLLAAVSTFDLNEPDEAEALFQAAIRLMPSDAAAQFRSPWLIARPAALQSYRQLGAVGRQEYVRAYWQETDPTPLTPANETQLEYWKRLTLADLFFGDAATGTRGWNTAPGETFVRYGFPHQAFYEQARFGDLSMQGGVTSSFMPPAWVWRYAFRDRSIDLVFRDVTLQGSFVADDATAMALADLRERAPAVFHDALPGEISQFFVSQAGFRRGPGETRAQVTVALSPFGQRADLPWWFGARIAAHVQDDRQETVATERWRIGAQHVAQPVAAAEMLLLDASFNLAPGRYALVGVVENRETGLSGSFSQPFYVRPFGFEELEISDLELGLPMHAGLRGHTNARLGPDYVTSPVGFVSGARGLGVYYEIYNLLPRGGGEVEFRVRYTVLPRGYVISHARRVRAGEAQSGDDLHLGRLGISLDGITLTRTNYSDVIFMPETTRLSAGARVPKRAHVPVPLLEPGDYALLVTVTDLVAGRSATAEAPFRITPEDRLRELLSGEGAR